jgi:hypothetical protein
LRQYLHRAAVDRRRTADIDAITLAGGVDLDLIDAAVLREVAVYGEGTDRVAGCEDAAVGHQPAKAAIAAQ